MNKTSWIIFSVFTVGILALLVIFSGNSKVDVSNIDVKAVQTASGQNGHIADHVFGKTGSKVTLIEYGDYQCPPCGQAYPLIKEVTGQYKDQVQFVFRNYPIPTLHANAKAAAASAEAAGLQGKYWEMHDKIYASQSGWSDLSITERSKYFEKLAGEIGLNIKKYSADLITTAINEKIDFDLAVGKKAGVEGTPTLYLNGVLLDSKSWSDKTRLKEAVDKELKKAGIALPK